MKQGRRELVRHTTQSTHERSPAESHEEHIQERCKGVETAVESTYMDLESESATAVSMQTPPVIIHQCGQPCVTYRPKSDASTQTIDSLHDHIYSLQLSSNTVGTQTTRELSSFKISTEKDSVFYTGFSLCFHYIIRYNESAW